MNRQLSEVATLARMAGARDVREFVERRLSERRAAERAEAIERERRETVRRTADRLARDNALCTAWEARFHATRAALRP